MKVYASFGEVSGTNVVLQSTTKEAAILRLLAYFIGEKKRGGRGFYTPLTLMQVTKGRFYRLKAIYHFDRAMIIMLMQVTKGRFY